MFISPLNRSHTGTRPGFQKQARAHSSAAGGPILSIEQTTPTSPATEATPSRLLPPPVPFLEYPSVPDYGDEDPVMKCQGPEHQWGTQSGTDVHVYGRFAKNGTVPESTGSRSGKRATRLVRLRHGATRLGQRPVVAGPLHPERRHKVIHLEASLQFYAESAQLKVSEDGEDFPTEKYFVHFPSAYKADGPGLRIAGQLYDGC
ncbi:hypothetical protein F5Y06DRAFT_292452 [Hypoxylon sp. FL0890]|nr:hypothetical protein F5Y06DRAFT_292452 [Hypoxylon sp. FL0890]